MGIRSSFARDSPRNWSVALVGGQGDMTRATPSRPRGPTRAARGDGVFTITFWVSVLGVAIAVVKSKRGVGSLGYSNHGRRSCH